jgi:hypothetical protein
VIRGDATWSFWKNETKAVEKFWILSTLMFDLCWARMEGVLIWCFVCSTWREAIVWPKFVMIGYTHSFVSVGDQNAYFLIRKNRHLPVANKAKNSLAMKRSNTVWLIVRLAISCQIWYGPLWATTKLCRLVAKSILFFQNKMCQCASSAVELYVYIVTLFCIRNKQGIRLYTLATIPSFRYTSPARRPSFRCVSVN